MGYSQSVCLAWLASSGLSPQEQERILDLVPEPGLLLDYWQKKDGFRSSVSLPERISQALTHNSDEYHLSFFDKKIRENRIQSLTYLDSDYPERLRPLQDAPAILFYQGVLSALSARTVAMIGSRNASYKGLESTRKIAEELSKNGISIISGLAYGVDSAAHKGCLMGGSPTVAVLGCGPDLDYPAENAGLKREILNRGGLVLSEYAPGEKPLGWHFPYRNRIISALGDCLAVMEARIRSGSMTTVQHALDQGKDVFVYPGEPGAASSDGNHQLLREGGLYFTSAFDLMEDMRWLDKNVIVEQNKACAPKDDTSLDTTERMILLQLERGEQSFDQLCSELNLPASQLNAKLSILQIRGLVNSLPGKLFSSAAKS